MTFGKYSYGNPTRRGAANKVTIGNFCSIAENVIFDCGFNHNSSFVSTFPFHQFFPELSNLPTNILLKGNISIGSDCWLGEGCTIMSNVQIGHGAVIGMRCIVSKDVLPYEIVVGAPQKVLRKRFTDKQIEGLLKLQWWDLPEDEIIKIAPLLQSNKIDELLKKYNLQPNLQT